MNLIHLPNLGSSYTAEKIVDFLRCIELPAHKSYDNARMLFEQASARIETLKQLVKGQWMTGRNAPQDGTLFVAYNKAYGEGYLLLRYHDNAWYCPAMNSFVEAPSKWLRLNQVGEF